MLAISSSGSIQLYQNHLEKVLAKVGVIGVVLAIIGAAVIFLVRRKKRRSVVEG
jgi:membrane protein DedA with SNARE-associated domain